MFCPVLTLPPGQGALRSRYPAILCQGRDQEPSSPTYLVISWPGRDPESTAHRQPSLHPWASGSQVGCRAMSDSREAGVVQGCSLGLPAGRGEGAGSAAVWSPHSRGTERWWGLLIHTHTPPHPLHTPTGLQSRDHRIRAPTLRQALHSAHPSLLSFTSLFLAQRTRPVHLLGWTTEGALGKPRLG